MVDWIMKVGMFKQALRKETVSPLPECSWGKNSMSGCGILPLSSIIKPKPVNEVFIETTVRKEKSLYKNKS